MTLEILMQIQVQRTVEGRVATVGDIRQWLEVVKQFPQVTDATMLLDDVDLAITFDDQVAIPTQEDEEDVEEGDVPLTYDHALFGSPEVREEVTADRGQC